ncbi:MAG TPA: GAF domain-containing protein, partial [Candidatus Dormibacteraeota bacterium]|nr:GAF domain-containing protein [Candidatus Dormibacteraeota bacterium]
MPEVSLARLRQVASLARSVAGTLDADAVLREVVEALRTLRPGAFCVVRLVDAERGGYRLAAMSGSDPHAVASVIPFGHGLTHAVAQSGHPMLLSDVSGDPRLVSAKWREDPGLKAYYGVPITA